MPIQPPQPQDNQAIAVIVLILAGICVRYWRTALLMLAVVIIALIVLGLIAEVHLVHHIIR